MRLKKELVYSITDRRNIFVLRQSNKTLVIKDTKPIIDSDTSMLEDKRGHRYIRNINNEQVYKAIKINDSFKIYTMI